MNPKITESHEKRTGLRGFAKPPLKGKFGSNHFGLPIKILKGTKNGFKDWKTNNKAIYSFQSNCVSEGFDKIVYRNNFFTIESQACYDYTILVHGYITFQVVEDEIYLYKYGEEYFDKANHDREIPTQTWTAKDFGQIKFENVDEQFLVQLRIKALTNNWN